MFQVPGFIDAQFEFPLGVVLKLIQRKRKWRKLVLNNQRRRVEKNYKMRVKTWKKGL